MAGERGERGERGGWTMLGVGVTAKRRRREGHHPMELGLINLKWIPTTTTTTATIARHGRRVEGTMWGGEGVHVA